MSSLTKSFQMLVSTNNGLFRSDKQKDFLMSQLDNSYLPNSFTGEGLIVWKTQVNIVYVCDDLGVAETFKFTSKKHSSGTSTWKRQDESTFLKEKAEKQRKKDLLVSTRKLYDEASNLVTILETLKTNHVETITSFDTSNDKLVNAFVAKFTKIERLSSKAQSRELRRMTNYHNCY
jgi:predicted Rdx family selenoprotein